MRILKHLRWLMDSGLFLSDSHQKEKTGMTWRAEKVPFAFPMSSGCLNRQTVSFKKNSAPKDDMRAMTMKSGLWNYQNQELTLSFTVPRG